MLTLKIGVMFSNKDLEVLPLQIGGTYDEMVLMP